MSKVEDSPYSSSSEEDSDTETEVENWDKIESQEKPTAYGFSEDCNSRFRRTMEDAHVSLKVFGESNNDYSFYAIYDGRGSVDLVSKTLHNILESELKATADVESAIRESFRKTDALIGQNKNDSSGSTAVVAFVQNKEKKLYVANCGDARAVLCANGKAHRLSHDHKATEENEVKRINDAGGFVVLNRVNGILAVARSFGDWQMKEVVISDPYVTVTELKEGDNYLILACDGLWDVCTDEKAVQLILQEESAQRMSDKLLRYALDNGSTDNISIMVVKL